MRVAASLVSRLETSGSSRPVSSEERRKDEAEQRLEGAQQQGGEDDHTGRDDGRQGATDVEVLERVDVGDGARQEVPGALLQPGWRQRFDGSEEPATQVGQDAQRAPMGDVALQVTEGCPRDGQDADRGDGQRHLGHVGHQGRLADEIGGHRHEPDVRADGETAEQRAGGEGRPERADVSHQTSDRAAAAGDAHARPVTGWPPESLVPRARLGSAGAVAGRHGPRRCSPPGPRWRPAEGDGR